MQQRYHFYTSHKRQNKGDWETKTLCQSSVTGRNPVLNKIHMFVRRYFLPFLCFHENQTWPHQPTYVIIAIMSCLISTSDTKVSPLKHIMFLHNSAFIYGGLAPTSLHNGSKNNVALAANVTIFLFFTHTRPPIHTHTHTHTRTLSHTALFNWEIGLKWQ